MTYILSQKRIQSLKEVNALALNSIGVEQKHKIQSKVTDGESQDFYLGFVSALDLALSLVHELQDCNSSVTALSLLAAHTASHIETDRPKRNQS